MRRLGSALLAGLAGLVGLATVFFSWQPIDDGWEADPAGAFSDPTGGYELVATNAVLGTSATVAIVVAAIALGRSR